MKQTVIVRNLTIGEGMPKICVPIVGTTRNEIMEEATAVTKISADLAEWRVDYYEEALDLKKVLEVAKDVRNHLKELPLLVTFRTSKEGGEKEIKLEDYVMLNKELAASGSADLIDVELFTGEEAVAEVIEAAHANGVKVVVSNHDFLKTPSKEEIVARLCKMQQLGADLPKIAVMPQTKSDVLELLQATYEMNETYADRPIITMSMGEAGLISRVAGETFGSAVTFGAAKKVSAPGQIGVEELRNVLTILHPDTK